VAGPSPLYLPQFKRWDKRNTTQKKKIDLVAELKSIITDGLVREMQGGKNQEAVQKGRMMAWALTYYLAQTKLDGLLRYYQELAKLPRDLGLDDEVLLVSFGRAFNLMDPANPNKLSDRELERFATDWYR